MRLLSSSNGAFPKLVSTGQSAFRIPWTRGSARRRCVISSLMGVKFCLARQAAVARFVSFPTNFTLSTVYRAFTVPGPPRFPFGFNASGFGTVLDSSPYLPWILETFTVFMSTPLLALAVFLLFTQNVLADTVRVAVAANFTAAMKEIATAFEQASGHKTLISYGSTGKLYAQILHNAPFEVFLAADQERPRLLADQKLGQAPFTYAVGKLVLWSGDRQREVSAQALKAGGFQRIALANPKTAPYGVAAVQIMEHLGVAKTLRPKWILGDNIAQTRQFVATGNVELGFVALAQIALKDSGSRWEIPQNLYDPILQDGMLLKRGENHPAARALITFLQDPTAQAIIQRFGYETVPFSGP